eukprot:GHRQ01005918.1.p1 GENE.GHRQ01005918.1~~GHRQ01005918.1.p1  ORF type:complete len:305 (+),score=112.87 GHRQ01005918.1:97-1011(+)
MTRLQPIPCPQRQWFPANSPASGSNSIRCQTIHEKPAPRHAPRHLDTTLAAAAGKDGLTSTHKVGRMNKLLQNVNLAGTSLFLQILGGNQSLALPHVTVPDISWVDWAALKAAGFKVCIFDKDNTLCKPFELAVSPALLPSFTACRSAFGGNVVLYSNSAGLQQYDPDGAEAAALEAAFEVQVLRHKDKKPAGGCEELQQQFKCEPHEMVFVGDRYLTDVVFGNRHGMLTIRVAPLTSRGEPPTVAAARMVEDACVRRWSAAGMKAPLQQLLPHDQCSRLVKQQQQLECSTQEQKHQQQHGQDR